MESASKQFTTATPAQRDGMHPRHFSIMAPGGSLAAAKLLMLCELAGTWPEQLRLLLVDLIGKPKGGYMGHLPILWTMACMVQGAQEPGQ